MWGIIVDFFLGLVGLRPSAQSKLDKVQTATDKELNRELQAQMPDSKEAAQYWKDHSNG